MFSRVCPCWIFSSHLGDHLFSLPSGLSVCKLLPNLFYESVPERYIQNRQEKKNTMIKYLWKALIILEGMLRFVSLLPVSRISILSLVRVCPWGPLCWLSMGDSAYFSSINSKTAVCACSAVISNYFICMVTQLSSADFNLEGHFWNNQ